MEVNPLVTALAPPPMAAEPRPYNHLSIRELIFLRRVGMHSKYLNRHKLIGRRRHIVRPAKGEHPLVVWVWIVGVDEIDVTFAANKLPEG